MTLQEDLKAKALALISQQMANWVVDIQRQIGEHQGNLVRTLDDLQESVAALRREDQRERHRDGDGRGGGEHAASASRPRRRVPASTSSRPRWPTLDKGTSLSEVLTYLVNEVAQYVDRAAMFIVKGPSAIGWYARGVEPAGRRSSRSTSRSTPTPSSATSTTRGTRCAAAMMHSPGTAQALARLGGNPQAVLAVPLILRDKLAAILYCDTTQEEVAAARRRPRRDPRALRGQDHRHALARAQDGAPPGPAPAAARRRPARRPRPRRAPAAAIRPRPPPDEGGSTVMFNAQQMNAMRPQAAGAVRAAPPPPPPPPAAPRCRPRRRRRTRTPSASPASW